MPETVVREPSLIVRYVVAGLIAISTPPLLAIPELRWLGWALLGVATIPSVLAYKSAFGRHMLVLIGMLVLLGVVPINTTITYSHIIVMGGVLALTILVPYAVTHSWFKEDVINFPFRTGRKWYRKEIAYILFAGVASYFILPFYLGTTGSYLNWDVVLEPSYIIRLFMGTNSLGIWDELFFVGICLALLRRHLPFWAANLAQATMWTAFLYELGFRGWGPFAIFLFALSQGLIFRKTKSVLYIITVHLTLDFVLFLVLIHLNHPDYLRIFITSPFN